MKISLFLETLDSSILPFTSDEKCYSVMKFQGLRLVCSPHQVSNLRLVCIHSESDVIF